MSETDVECYRIGANRIFFQTWLYHDGTMTHDLFMKKAVEKVRDDWKATAEGEWENVPTISEETALQNPEFKSPHGHYVAISGLQRVNGTLFEGEEL